MSKRRMVMNKTLAGLMTAAMIAGTVPVNVYAVTGDAVAKDGTYTSTQKVINNSEDEDEWDDYDVEVTVTVKDGKISSVEAVTADEEGESYVNKAVNKKKGINTLLAGSDATEAVISGFEADAVSGATCSANAVKAGALAAIQSADEAVEEIKVDTAALEKAIADAEGLKKDDYTEDSFASVTDALANAKKALEAKASQDEVDAAEKALSDAVDALVVKADLSSAEVVPEKESYDYTGSPVKPAVTVTLGGKTLAEGTDYTVAYENNTEVGTAKVVVTGKGAYTGTASAEFTIKEVKKDAYVLMNIPYGEFYASEFASGSSVDAVTTATASKPKMTMFAGSYHLESGEKILGLTYPVYVSDMSVLADYERITDESAKTISYSNHGNVTTVDLTGKDVLFESGTYAYYVLDEAPAFYKELTANGKSFSFGKSTASVQSGSGVTAELLTESGYGDYQMEIDGLPGGTVLGIVVNTKEGDAYAMRHLENIWRGGSEIAWSTGHVTVERHGNSLSYANFRSMEGQTITDLTVYTNDGIVNYDVEDMYVPLKTESSVTVADAEISAGSTSVTMENLPEDYKASYSVEGLEMSVADGVMTFKSALPGAYTLVVTDESGKYASMRASFTLSSRDMPAAFNGNDEAPALVKAEDAKEEDFANYLKNIATVTVDGTDYRPFGRGGKRLVSEDGSIVMDTDVFGENKTYEVKVTSTGYPVLEFDLNLASCYVLMNIPYAEFYAAEFAAGSDVDAVTTATMSKPKMFNMFAGSYHTEDGGQILGVTYPVYVSDISLLADYTRVTDESARTISYSNHGNTTTVDLAGKDVLFESETYAYYVLAEAPACYKTLNVSSDGAFSFSETNAEVQTGSGLTAELSTQSGYGDYQLNLTGLSAGQVLGVVLNTKEGDAYAMRHLENIWRGGAQLAWSTGHVTVERHGNALSYEDFRSMEGQTITDLTVYTDEGVVNYDIDDVYVPIKTDASVTVADALVSAGSTSVTEEGMPADYAPVYAAEGLECKVENGTLTFGKDTLPGSYTLEVSDGSGKYAPVTASFTLSSEEMPAQYNEDEEAPALEKTEEADEAAFANYLKNISSVSVNGTSYPAFGRGSVRLFDETGKLDTAAAPFAEGSSFEIVVTSTGYEDLSFTYEKSFYVMMNIPYAEFYAADLNNDVDVDVFTSATLSKPKAMNLSGGSYHKEDGSEITGVTFPVRISGDVDLSAYTQVTDEDSLELTVSLRGQTSTTTYTGVDVLFERPSYAYYVLSEAPAFYKELTVGEDGSFSFGAVVGEAKALEGVEAELSTESRYGDYQLDLDGLTEAAALDLSTDRIYGVIVSTKEGNDYGMRHLENLWRGFELAWCTGFTENVHGCVTSSDHYEAMMGQTINKVTYLTSKGIFTIALDIYVPVKTAASVEVADAAITAGKTAMTIKDLPADFEPVFEVTAPDGSVYDAMTITKTAAINTVLAANGLVFAASDTIAESSYDLAYGSDAALGTYEVTVKDGSGKYAAMSDSFEIFTEDIPAEYNKDGKAPALVKTEEASEEDFTTYLSKITKVNVNGTDYAASGRFATKLFDETGKLDTTAAPFAEGDSFEITVSADGYADLTFTYSPSDTPEVPVDTSELEAAVKEAEALKAEDYTEDSWSKAGFPDVLTTAKEVLAAAESQDAVDKAAKTLKAAIEALEKKTEESETETETETKKETETQKETQKETEKETKKAPAAATAAASKGSGSSPKTGDPTSVMGLAGLAIVSAATCGISLKRRKKSKKEDDEA